MVVGLHVLCVLIKKVYNTFGANISLELLGYALVFDRIRH